MRCKKNICSFPPEIAETCGIKLCMMWDVYANDTYDIPQYQAHRASKNKVSMSGEGVVVMRTHSGAGRMYHEEGTFELTPGTLLLFDFQRVKRYHTVEADWCYWWFEINCDTPLHIPRHRVLNVPLKNSDEEEFQSIFTMIRREDFQDRCFATASFIRLLYSWWARCADRKRRLPHEQRMLKVVDEMHKRLYSTFTVEEMARFAGLSVTGFRKAFKDITAKSPKKFFDDLKMSMAMELLRSGQLNVSEVAEELGFCDPYHFSKMFSKHFGMPPSKV